MKKFIGIGLVTVLSIMIFSCGSSKVKAQNEHPFKVLEANYVNSAGEQPDLVKTTIKISIDNKEIQLDSVYFRNSGMPLNRLESIENAIFTASFMTSTILHDYILDSDPKQEFGNKPPVPKAKLPFELIGNEAVVSYFYKDKINYYKISEVKEE